MSESSHPERDFEKLSKAITEAVIKSEKVRKVVAEIQTREEICSQSFMVLVLSMHSLMDALENADSESMEEKVPVKRPRKKKVESEQFIDGNRLTKNEIAFQEFLKEKFDNDEWLKRNGLKF